ncbi:MAG: ZIP family metal transporter [Bacteroidales bacterium]|nr:ZIP family metal transporter [Bacteroidales bacterium]
MQLIIILIALTVGSAGSVAIAGSLLLLKQDKLDQISNYLLTLAGGTLLGAAYLGMLPKAVKLANNADSVFVLTLTGIVLFFITEKVILWRACGNKQCERHNNASAPLILIGDALHNFIDGIIITTAFFTSLEFGVVVTLTVLFHEIPQELADFGILIKNGYSKSKALAYNMASGLTAFLGGLIAYFTLDSARKFIPWVLALSAASFTYIALADLVPQMHKKQRLKILFFR